MSYSKLSKQRNLPRGLLADFPAVVFHVLVRSINITSGVQGGIFLLPILGIFVYSILYFSCRSSRQIQQFSASAEQRLGKGFLEAVDGIKYTRMSGRTKRNLAAAFEMIDQSQRWYYAKLCRLGSVLFLCDLHSSIHLTALVYLATYKPQSCSQSGIGLSFWSCLCLSHALECLARQLSEGEVFLANAHEVLNVVQTIPVEDDEPGIDVPSSWPDCGKVEFDHVTAKYK